MGDVAPLGFVKKEFYLSDGRTIIIQLGARDPLLTVKIRCKCNDEFVTKILDIDADGKVNDHDRKGVSQGRVRTTAASPDGHFLACITEPEGFHGSTVTYTWTFILPYNYTQPRFAGTVSTETEFNDGDGYRTGYIQFGGRPTELDCTSEVLKDYRAVSDQR